MYRLCWLTGVLTVIDRLWSWESTDRDGDSAELGTSAPVAAVVFTDFGATNIPHTYTATGIETFYCQNVSMLEIEDNSKCGWVVKMTEKRNGENAVSSSSQLSSLSISLHSHLQFSSRWNVQATCKTSIVLADLYTRNLSKAHETHFQFSSYSFENCISLGLGPSGP